MKKLKNITGVIAVFTTILFIYLLLYSSYLIGIERYSILVSLLYMLTKQTVAVFSFIIMFIILLILTMILVGEE